MIRIKYKSMALGQIHTGSDSNTGTLRQLRREMVFLSNPKQIQSRFSESQRKLRRQAVALLLLRLWQKMEDKARVTIYSEIAATLVVASSQRNKESMLNFLCQRLGIRQITTAPDGHFDVVDILELFNDEELSQLIREEHQYIIAVFRKLKDEDKDWQKQNKKKAKISQSTLFDDASGEINPVDVIEEELVKVQQQLVNTSVSLQLFDFVPVISGNSVRGALRRLCMYDFYKQLGISDVFDAIYHMTNTGGIIEKAKEEKIKTKGVEAVVPHQDEVIDTAAKLWSKIKKNLGVRSAIGIEDLDMRNKLIDLCPMIGLFGTAIGNQTIQGELRMGDMVPVCYENNTGEISYHNYLDTTFGTRLDSEKLENKLNIISEEGKAKETHQMMYQYEVFAKGTPFNHSIGCTSNKDLIVSAFWRMVRLFEQNPYVCAKSSVGKGEVDLSELISQIPEGSDQLYLDHLHKNTDYIKSYFDAMEIEKLASA